MTSEIVILRNATWQLDTSFVLGPMTRTFREHELIMIKGANGTGKTTLLRGIAGLLKEEHGIVIRPLSSLFLSTRPSVREDLLVQDQLQFWQTLYQKKIQDIVEIWGLGNLLNRPIGRLSTGQRQRVSLMRLSLARDKLWLLDEPFHGLDATYRTRLTAAISHHTSQGGCVVMATHDEADLIPNQMLELRSS